jgi:hypothetical protein
MKKLRFILVAVSFVFASCSSNDDTSTQTEDSQKLEKMYTELIELSLVNSQSCTNSEEWSFTLINSSACGADAGYIPYSKKTNTVVFLAKVKKYQDAKKAFDTKWKIASTCDIRVAPTGVKCEDGKPVLTYNPILY